MKPLRYRSAMLSISPMITPTVEAARNMGALDKLDERRVMGQRLVVLEAATLMMRLLRRTAPEIDGVKYADELDAVFSVAQDGEVTFSIIGRNKERASTPTDNEIAFLYPRGTLNPQTQKWYEILREYQPFPVTLYPMPTGPSEPVGLVVRKVSREAVEDAARRIESSRIEIQRRLESVGVKVEISTDNDPKSVQTDLAFAVIQIEYGLGRRADSHWRPALEALKSEMGVLGSKFTRYLINGDESIFDVDNTIKEVSNIEELGSALQERLARSAGLKLTKL